MCIAIHSDGHLRVEFLYEQNLPVLCEGQLSFVECYDVILRNFSDKPLNDIYFLCSNLPNENRIVEPYNRNQIYLNLTDVNNPSFPTYFDEIYEDKPVGEGGNLYKVQFSASIAGSNSADFRAIKLTPKIKNIPWLKGKAEEDSLENQVSGYFLATGMTLMRLGFREGAIEPYDPQQSEQTTYWLRFSFESFPNPFFQTKPKKVGHIKKQNCIAIDAQTVLNNLQKQLTVLRKDGSGDVIDSIEDHVLNKLFYRPKTSTIISQHRISILPTENVSLADGFVDFEGNAQTPILISKSRDDLIRTWVFTSNLCFTLDPLVVSCSVYQSFRKCSNPKTFKELCDIFKIFGENNISHIISTMHSRGLLSKEDGPSPVFSTREHSHELAQKTLLLDYSYNVIPKEHRDYLNTLSKPKEYLGDSKLITRYLPPNWVINLLFEYD